MLLWGGTLPQSAAGQTIRVAGVVVPSILDALDLLAEARCVIATLRC